MKDGLLCINNNVAPLAYKGDLTIRHIYIGRNVTSIGTEAFSLCPNIESIEVDPDNEYFTSNDRCNAIIKKSDGTLLTGCSKTTIPQYVSEIAPFAFRGQTSLKQITIPRSVRKIGSFSFDGCSELKEVKIGEGVEYIGEYCFKKCENLKTIYLPNKKIDIDATIFGVPPFNWNDMEASLIECEKEPRIEPHFEGILNIFFDGNVEDYFFIGDFIEQYLSCSFIENTRIIKVHCKDATLTHNKWNFSI